MNADETKRCAKCWRYLPLSDFAHDGRTRDRLTYRCNDCRTIVPINDTNSSNDTAEPADRNDRTTHGRFIPNPHFHGDH